MNRNTKRTVIIGSLLLSSLHLAAAEEPVFTNGLLHNFDGTLINAKHIAQNGQLVQLIKSMQWGVKTKDGGLSGLHLFKDKLHSIHDLRALEAQLELDICAHPDSSELLELAKDLKKILEKVKHDFITKVLPYQEPGKAFRPLTLQLTEEFCLKYKRPDSFLLSWSTVPEAKEVEFFRTNIHSFKELDIFCTDLIKFLKVFVTSCPLAFAEFEKEVALRKKARAENAPAAH